MSDLDEAAGALWAIPPHGMGNDEWVRVGMAWKAAGGNLAQWEAWSRQDAERFTEGDCAKRWKSFDESGKVTARTLFGMANEHGWRGEKRLRATANKPRLTTPPAPLDLTSEQQLKTCLETLFKPDEQVCIVTGAKLDEKRGKWRPSGSGTCHIVSDLLSKLESGSVEDAIGSYNHKAGAWFCPNPVNGAGHKNNDVTAFRHVLVESDEVPVAGQERIISNLALPVSTLALSGGKSVHALVKVDADGSNHYAERVSELYAVCDAAGLSVDPQNKNPGRLTRLPGCARGEAEQRLLAVSVGASSWNEWQRGRKPPKESEEVSRILPPIHRLNLHDLPQLRPELIEGVLRVGHIMAFSAASKQGKTQALIELAVAIATGGKWFGMQCTQGRVLYIDGETDPASFVYRFYGITDRVAPGMLNIVEAGIDTWNLRGRAAPLPSLASDIVRAAQGGGYDVMILDPAYPFMDGDENSAGDMREFCNTLTEMSEMLKCTVVFDHHHSKGAQGDKESMHRMSGSGMFSRHPDAIVDMIKLCVPEEQRVSLGMGDSDSAFRVSFDLREFPQKQPFGIFFRHPIHVRDYEGVLDELEPMTGSSKGGQATARRAKLENLGKVGALEAVLDEMRKERGNEPLDINEVAERFGHKTPTTKKHLDSSKRYCRVNPTASSCVVVAVEEAAAIQGSDLASLGA